MILATLSFLFLSVGAIFLLIAGVGVLRLPDIYCRASAATKAATFGIGLMLIGTALYFESTAVATRVVATLAFVLLTSPISAHVICRAAYRTGVPLCEATVTDELAGKG